VHLNWPEGGALAPLYAGTVTGWSRVVRVTSGLGLVL
jgi:hypothetical protein